MSVVLLCEYNHTDKTERRKAETILHNEALLRETRRFNMSINPQTAAIWDLMNQEINNKYNDPYGNRAKDLIRMGGIGTTTRPTRYWIAAVGFFAFIVLGILILSNSGHLSSRLRPLDLWKDPGLSAEESQNRYLSAVEQLGETIRVTETRAGVWKITKSVTGGRSLKLDEESNYYQYLGADSAIWFRYNTSYKYPRWQCWYRPVSGDYGNYGWMECRDGKWYIEDDDGEWIKLPGRYDTSPLFYIQTG